MERKNGRMNGLKKLLNLFIYFAATYGYRVTPSKYDEKYVKWAKPQSWFSASEAELRRAPCTGPRGRVVLVTPLLPSRTAQMMPKVHLKTPLWKSCHSCVWHMREDRRSVNMVPLSGIKSTATQKDIEVYCVLQGHWHLTEGGAGQVGYILSSIPIPFSKYKKWHLTHMLLTLLIGAYFEGIPLQEQRLVPFTWVNHCGRAEHTTQEFWCTLKVRWLKYWWSMQIQDYMKRARYLLTISSCHS